MTSAENNAATGRLLLLDANAVLNAALLPESFTAQAVALAKQSGGWQFLISAGVMREVEKTLCDKSPDLVCELLAKEKIEVFLLRMGATSIPDDHLSPAPELITQADGHVFHAARRIGATLLTSDAGLWWGCRVNYVSTISPLELIREINSIALQTTVFGVPPTPQSGSLFARAYPGAWANGRQGRYTVVSFPGGFWLHYDAAKSSWVALVEGLKKPLEVSAPVKASTMQTVCLSWKALEGKAAIKLRVAGCGHPACEALTGPLSFRPSGVPTVGSLCGVEHFWNGHIYFCISSEKPVGDKSWKKYQNHRDLAPNPYDSDRLAGAISALAVRAVPPASTFP
jgi:predicted nucleic acid-binding protein